MNENVGASFGLSVLVVVFFAVALFEPEAGRAAKKTAEDSPRRKPVEAQPPTPAPPPTPIDMPQPVSPEPVASTRGGASGMAKHVVSVAKRSTPTVVAARGIEPRGAEPRVPAGPFTEARSGETLEDVAWRVYGSDRAVDSLRKANRDLLRDEDVPLVAGALIRTP